MKIHGIILAILFTVMGCASTESSSDSSADTGNASTESASTANTESSTPAESSTAASSDTSNASTTSASMSDGGTTVIASEIPFAEHNSIAGNIKHDCHLPKKLSDFIKTYADSYHVPLELKPTVSSSDPGRVLVIEITDAMSAGNAFIGHRKYTQIAGKLYQDGKAIGSFEASRNSGGGAFAGFKSSCAVLGRTVKVLGRDVANWLKAPAMNSMLGDMR